MRVSSTLVFWLALTATLMTGSPGLAARPEPADHWAFQPMKEVVPPWNSESADWAETEIDLFILEKLEEAELKPAPPADARTLLRRIRYGLHGLPPEAEDIEAFSADWEREGPAALERWIDRYLASPRYGEAWGRHWLDVARYADSKGYVYAREERFFIHAWVYRDWVIRALNEGMPFDRFLLLQIAADQTAPPDSPDLAAMGFLTLGRRFIGVTHDIIDDRIDVVTRGTMALTVQCARCHDHKYDPVTQRDYYALYGVFHQDRDRLVRLGAAPDERLTDASIEYRERSQKLAETMRARREEAAARLRARVADYLDAQFALEQYPEEGFDQILTENDLIPASVRRWRDYLERSAVHFDPLFAPWHALAGLEEEGFAGRAETALAALLEEKGDRLNPGVAQAFATPPRSRREAAEIYGRLFAEAEAAGPEAGGEAAAGLRGFLFDPHSPATVPDTGIVNNELFFPTAICEELWKLQGELDRWLIQDEGAAPHAVIVASGEVEPDPRIFERGDPSRLGPATPRSFPAFLSDVRAKPFTAGKERREMAEAIVDPENPLTARVIVNRVWQRHFGVGLVRTASDFGLRSAPPSHPDLLDWLARKLIEDGWDLKALHRSILRSALYRQASAGNPAAEEKDPGNRWLGRHPVRRLGFEELRDSLLFVTGELEFKLGGRPEEVFGPENRRRSVYGLVDRQFLPGVFRTFDFANPDEHVARRFETTAPQQALFLLNHRFTADRAAVLGASGVVQTEDRETRDWVRALYGRVLQRAPTPEEEDAARDFLAAAPEEGTEEAPDPWVYGVGRYDEDEDRVSGFEALPYFNGESWQGGPEWPDPAWGWARLTAAGGHPGNDRDHAVIRRWIAPEDGVVEVRGVVRGEGEPGDGVRAFVVSSREGLLASAAVHRSEAPLEAVGVVLRAGDTLDFVTDCGEILNSDEFSWSPVVTMLESERRWKAREDFGAGTARSRLGARAQLAQVLLLSNEFVFLD
ncbi:MAG TPA: DUF1549 and DUF1553 domain-containing protein [Verrucomicrobiales bacterium]|nr:DUF1549 and DUF1553 domain-containing protein [Verrucomicrobiales bacterium]